jgi:cell shape-determining protein MreC
MRPPLLPTLIILLLAAAIRLFPDGIFQDWRLRIRGAFARLERPEDPRLDVSAGLFSDQGDLLDLLAAKNSEIADLRLRLAELGVSRDAVPSARIIPAKVIGLGPEDNLDVFTIDAGRLDGVEIGQAVVTGRALAGVVARSGERASLVLSLSSPGCYLSVRLSAPEATAERPRQLGAVRGGGGGRVRSIIFAPDEEAREGWLALTSGLEKGIPEGLIIGSLTDRFVEGEESGTMETGLSPAADLASLNFVAVVAVE